MLWGRRIGAVTWDERRAVGVFQYDPEFVPSGIEVSPITMPLRTAPYEFSALPREAFKGLPGMLADALPDRFGNRLIDEWCARTGRDPESFNPVQRLCYVGTRAMGALEFEPWLRDAPTSERRLEVAELVELANQVLTERQGLNGVLAGKAEDEDAIEDILRVGTSAGGARAKAVLAYNEATGEFRSGQVPAGQGFRYYLIKFDGVGNNRDRELADPGGFGLVEYACSLMAVEAGIEMTHCRLHREGGRSHFMTRRFDRTDSGHKLHMQTLAGLMHFDFNAPGSYSYEQAILAMRRLRLPADQLEQLALRAMFNLVIRNQDDHVKNIAFLMDKDGTWRLAPAYDVVYSYNPNGAWTSHHQMRLNGKNDNFVRDDLMAFAEVAGLRRVRATGLLERVLGVVERWPKFAEAAGVPATDSARIARAFRRL